MGCWGQTLTLVLLDLGLDEKDRILIGDRHLELGAGQRLDDDVKLGGPHFDRDVRGSLAAATGTEL